MPNLSRATTASFARWFVSALLLLWLGSAGARADEPEPEPAPGPAATPEPPEPAPAPMQDSGAFGTLEEQVQEYLAKARSHFTAGRYDAAIVELQSAYRLKPNPNYLFSIGQSHRRAGRNREALSYYQRFLKESPDTPLKVETTNYISELTLLIRQQDVIEMERKRPVWKRAWFWSVIGGSAATVALGIGLGVTLRDGTESIGFSFGPGAMTGALLRSRSR